MVSDVADHIHSHTMEQLEKIKKTSSAGQDYWLAREIGPVLGYPKWGAFEPVIKRAETAMIKNGVDPAHHIIQTKKAVTAKNNATIEARDYFLSRGACYLIAMNGESSKPEVAAAQAYFAVQTRRMEEQDAKHVAKPDDVKRLNLRDKVTASFKRVSGVAENAGVRRERQGMFHDQRYVGLYGLHTTEVYEKKGLKSKEQLFDRAGTLELSAHDFQMNLAASVIEKDDIQGEQAAIKKNLEVAKEVRRAIIDSGATVPEDLPLVEHISTVRKRITGKRSKPPASLQSDAEASPQLPLSSPNDAKRK